METKGRDQLAYRYVEKPSQAAGEMTWQLVPQVESVGGQLHYLICAANILLVHVTAMIFPAAENGVFHSMETTV